MHTLDGSVMYKTADFIGRNDNRRLVFLCFLLGCSSATAHGLSLHSLLMVDLFHKMLLLLI